MIIEKDAGTKGMHAKKALSADDAKGRHADWRSQAFRLCELSCSDNLPIRFTPMPDGGGIRRSVTHASSKPPPASSSKCGHC
jgi:hypothetical protein